MVSVQKEVNKGEPHPSVSFHPPQGLQQTTYFLRLMLVRLWRELDTGSGSGVGDGGHVQAGEVGGHDLVLAGPEHEGLEVRHGCVLDRGLDLCARRRHLKMHDEVDDGHVDGGHAERRAAGHG